MNGLKGDGTEPLPTGSDSEVIPGKGGLMKLLLLLGIGIAVLLLLNFTAIGTSRIGDLRLALQELAALGINEKFGFILVTSVLVFAGMPRLLFFGLGGLMMGFTEGFGAALIASIIGSYFSFRIMRWAGRDWISRRFAGKRLIGKIIGIQPNVLPVFMVRQLPVSNVILNACLAMSRVKDHTFLFGSLLGFIPQGAAAALIGSGSSKGRFSEGIANLAGAAALITGIALWTYWQRTRTADSQTLPINAPE